MKTVAKSGLNNIPHTLQNWNRNPALITSNSIIFPLKNAAFLLQDSLIFKQLTIEFIHRAY